MRLLALLFCFWYAAAAPSLPRAAQKCPISSVLQGVEIIEALSIQSACSSYLSTQLRTVTKTKTRSGTTSTSTSVVYQTSTTVQPTTVYSGTVVRKGTVYTTTQFSATSTSYLPFVPTTCPNANRKRNPTARNQGNAFPTQWKSCNNVVIRDACEVALGMPSGVSVVTQFSTVYGSTQVQTTTVSSVTTLLSYSPTATLYSISTSFFPTSTQTQSIAGTTTVSQTTFSHVPCTQSLTLATSGAYTILADSGPGGNYLYDPPSEGNVAGSGSSLYAEVNLPAGVYEMVIGQAGGDGIGAGQGGGGGGGTFMFDSNSNLVFALGGGGGAGYIGGPNGLSAGAASTSQATTADIGGPGDTVCGGGAGAARDFSGNGGGGAGPYGGNGAANGWQATPANGALGGAGGYGGGGGTSVSSGGGGGGYYGGESGDYAGGGYGQGGGSWFNTGLSYAFYQFSTYFSVVKRNGSIIIIAT